MICHVYLMIGSKNIIFDINLQTVFIMMTVTFALLTLARYYHMLNINTRGQLHVYFGIMVIKTQNLRKSINLDHGGTLEGPLHLKSVLQGPFGDS